ncbi:MAG: hypothetical protein WDO19_16070 [Bacteroidota bacterium]
MATSPLDIELSKYWLLLTTVQKESLLTVIKSFTSSTEAGNQEMNEPAASYGKKDTGFPVEVLQQLTWEQKEALISLVESFGIEIPGQRISIEQYNKELDDAEAEFEKGEFMSHEEVVALSKKWIHGQ